MGTFANSEDQDEMPHNAAALFGKEKMDLQRNKYIFWKSKPVTSQHTQWTILTLL